MDRHTEIRILLGYRGGLHRKLLAAALSGETDLKVVAELTSTDRLMTLAQRTQADVAVLDIALPGSVGATEMRALPAGCRMLVVLDRRSGGAVIRSLIRLTPRVGLISTEATPARLVDGIRRLVRGEAVLDPELAITALQSTRTGLTNRERDVLQLTQQGATAPEIATRLCLSTGTVRNYVSKILAKTGSRNRIEALRFANEAGWI